MATHQLNEKQGIPSAVQDEVAACLAQWQASLRKELSSWSEDERAKWTPTFVERGLVDFLGLGDGGGGPPGAAPEACMEVERGNEPLPHPPPVDLFDLASAAFFDHLAENRSDNTTVNDALVAVNSKLRAGGTRQLGLDEWKGFCERMQSANRYVCLPS